MEHSHEHTHVHSHDGVEHTHTHTHPHGHDHDHGPHDHPHTHDHGHDLPEGADRTLAVLTYMLDHNVHHCAELKEMAASLTGEAQHQLLHAVEAFEEANSHLAKAVAELK
ncbi:MAG: cobalt transporter [Oscillospiraceae bacterium]|jgi:hypothetical protein|nr:cobalt transporter [Oscillospiraceae bacterium]MCI9587068.1 cobalt transporter [Oscillospiraceae bacterium]